MAVHNIRRHESIVQDAEDGRNQYNEGLRQRMGEMSMVGMVLKKAATVLLTILKWILMAVLMLLKLVLGIAKLFLLLLALAARVVLTMVGVMAGRR